MAMLHFIGASIVWWLGVCAPLLLGIAKLNSGECFFGAISCTLMLVMVPYGLSYLKWAGESYLPRSEFVPIYD